jgi:hypothetical protein
VFSLCDTKPFSVAVVNIPIWLRRLSVLSPARFGGERRQNKPPEGMGLVGLRHPTTTLAGINSFPAERHVRPPPFPLRETLPAELTEDRMTTSCRRTPPRWGEIPKKGK